MTEISRVAGEEEKASGRGSAGVVVPDVVVRKVRSEGVEGRGWCAIRRRSR
jgi:hypothetical protein